MWEVVCPDSRGEAAGRPLSRGSGWALGRVGEAQSVSLSQEGGTQAYTIRAERKWRWAPTDEARSLNQ
jgi:hypothetical protein